MGRGGVEFVSRVGSGVGLCCVCVPPSKSLTCCYIKSSSCVRVKDDCSTSRTLFASLLGGKTSRRIKFLHQFVTSRASTIIVGDGIESNSGVTDMNKLG